MALSTAGGWHSSALALGTISGEVSNVGTAHGVRGVRIQLINGNGAVEQTTVTDRHGRYTFEVSEDGPFIVRELTPRGFTQVLPTITTNAPTGALVAGAGNSSWDYGVNTNPAAGPVGPAAWDAIAPAGDLPFESPINLTGPTVDLGKYLTIDYYNTIPKQIINNSHQIQVQTATGALDFITLRDPITGGLQQFNLSQFHYHDPSEHTVNGQHYTLEEHFVNTSSTGAETVLGVFLQLGPHNDALDPILNAASANLTRPNSATTISTPINFQALLPTSLRGWFYQGSLTTPPLSQPVNWLVFQTPITLDAQQLATYEAVAANSGFLPNARPVQPLDGRRLNQFDNDVDFQGRSIENVDFAILHPHRFR